MGGAHQSRQVLEGDPGPVGHQVDGAPSRRAGALRAAGSRGRPTPAPRRPGRRGTEARFGSGSSGSSPPGARRSRSLTQANGVVDRLGAPHGIVGRSLATASFSTARNTGAGEAVQHPAGVPEPHRVGHEDQDGPGQRPAAQLPHPVGEGGTGRRCAPAGRCPRCSRREESTAASRGAARYQRNRMGYAMLERTAASRYTGGQGVQALHQDAPPAVGDGAGVGPGRPGRRPPRRRAAPARRR